MITPADYRLFNPGGCLTAQALRGYIEGSLRIQGRHEVENHLRYCKICSEAYEGFKKHHQKDIVRSDIEFLSRRIRRVYKSGNDFSRRYLPVFIIVSVIVTFLLLMAVYYILKFMLTK